MEVGAKHTAVDTALGLAVRKGIKGRALHHGPAGVDLIPRQLCPGKGLCRDRGRDLGAALLLREDRPGGQQAQPPQGLHPATLAAGGVVQLLAQNLVAAADAQNRCASLGQL